MLEICSDPSRWVVMAVDLMSFGKVLKKSGLFFKVNSYATKFDWSFSAFQDIAFSILRFHESRSCLGFSGLAVDAFWVPAGATVSWRGATGI